MKIKAAILLLFVCAIVFAQERKPITLIVEQELVITSHDNGVMRSIKKQAGDSITLVEPSYISRNEIMQIETTEGIVSAREVRRCIAYSEVKRYLDWAGIYEKLNKTPFELKTEKQKLIQAQMKAMSRPHKYLTIFTGDLELNFSHQRLLDFLGEYLNMSEKSNDFENGKIVSRCTERTAINKQKTLTIKYTVRTENDYFFPTQVEITGIAESVIKFFVLYYPTKINADERRSGEYISYMLPDKITLTIDRAGGAKVIITHNNE